MRALQPVADRRTRLIALVAGKQTQILDVAGPAEVFSRCARILASEHPQQPPAYRIVLLNTGASGIISTSAGIELSSAESFAALRELPDTLLVVGGTDIEQLTFGQEFVAWLRARAGDTRRIGSVCTGAFALASAGILDDKRATTHWAWAEQLATRFPRVRVDADLIFVRDGKVWTSAGVTAGMDLALALVEDDHGSAVSLRIAREMVLFLRRPGSQSQFSATLEAQVSDRAPIRELQLWLPGHLKEDLSLPNLAARVGMSLRHFTRVFSREVGMPPGEYVERLRADAACVRLTNSSHGLRRIASECEFRSSEVLRRTLQRVHRITPEQYRSRFGPMH